MAFGSMGTLTSSFPFEAEVVLIFSPWALRPNIRASGILIHEAAKLLSLPLVLLMKPIQHWILRVSVRLSLDRVARDRGHTPSSAFGSVEVREGPEEVVNFIKKSTVVGIHKVPSVPCIHRKSNIHVASESRC